MFSKEMEALIQATLEDGVLEENEKAALVKRAQKEGIDLDELEIYINSIQQKKQRELKEKNEALDAKYEKEKKEALGPVCPRCHKQVPPLTLVCDCGYEFSKKERNSTMDILNKNIAEIETWTKKSSESQASFEDRKLQAKIDAIKMLPIPNTKEDIIEFLSMSLPNSKKKGGLWGTKSGRALVIGLISLPIAVVTSIIMYLNEVEGAIIGLIAFSIVIWPIFIVSTGDRNPTFEHNHMVDSWRMKFDQVMLKGRSLQGDPDFQRQLDYYENMLKKK